MVSSAGYNPSKRIAGGNYDHIDLQKMVTNLCVMDFGGANNAVRVITLHPGVTFEAVQEATGFELINAVEGETALPNADALSIINKLDPHGFRANVIRDNPPAIRN